jgi:hypothetical protein
MMTRKSLAVALALTSSTAFVSSAWADDYDSVCGGATPPTGQKLQYCQAAKQAKDAAKKENTLFGVYAAVSGVCTASCMSWITATYDPVCQGGAIGASVTEMVMTKNFMGGFMNGLSGAIGLKKSLDYNKSGVAGNGAETELFGEKFKTTCITAATSALSAYTHKSSASSSKRIYEQNLAYAKSIHDSVTPGINAAPTLTRTSSTGTILPSAAGTATALNTTTSGESSANPSGECGDTNGVSGAATCAATADPNVANTISSPDFQKAFEKSSGMNLGEYLKGAGNFSPSDAIKAATGSVMSADATPSVDKALAEAEKEASKYPLMGGDASAAYAAGGGHGGGGGSGDADFANAMNGLMGKLLPKSDQDKKGGVSEVKFSGPQRNLASASAEDPTISIFDRVAFRYSSIMPRILADPTRQSLSEWSKTKPKDEGATKRN